MITRKIGKLLRGNATPYQIYTAALLGTLSAAVPGISQSPLLLVLLFCAVVVIHANLMVVALSFLIAKLLFLLLLPLHFHSGVYLLEGPLNGLVAVGVNAPVTAWFGLEYYVTLPALISAVLLGVVAGWGLNRTLRLFRVKMSQLESDSEKFKVYTAKKWVRFLAWVLVGGLQGKQSWSQLSQSTGRGSPVRPIGIVFIASLLVLGYFSVRLLDSQIVTQYLRSSLERINGATVELAGLELDLRQNRLTINGLEMADPEALRTNRFAAGSIVMDLSGMSLLAKKAVIDHLEVIDGQSGTERRLPGRRTVPATKPEQDAKDIDLPGMDDVLENAQQWRERMAAVKRLYERFAPYLERTDDGQDEAAVGTPGWRERLAQRAAESGYAQVSSETVLRGSPRLLIRSLTANRIRMGGSEERYTVIGSNLSTHPALVTESGTLRLQRDDERFLLQLAMPSVAAPAVSQIEVVYREMPMERLARQVGDKFPFSGGTLDFSGSGTIDNTVLDLPLRVMMNNTTLTAFGSTVALNQLPLDVTVLGPLDNPRIDLPKDALENAVRDGAKQRIRSEVEERAGDALRRFIPRGD